MITHIFFDKLKEKQETLPLKQECLQSMTSPQDGMWESFREASRHWIIRDKSANIGYACVDDEKQLIQFFLKQDYLSLGESIFTHFLQHTAVIKGIVGTNNPTYLSLALATSKKIKLHSYLFRDHLPVSLEEKAGTLLQCQAEELEKIVQFYIESIGASRDWLLDYVGERIAKKEIYSLEHHAGIIGTCEVRNSPSSAQVVDIGMAVAPSYRRQGYGSYLLHQAKLIALTSGKTPICSCERENTGSFKAINHAGFRSLYQLLEVDFA
ncbi:MAG: GNAT family N-acetyltransferase [Bacteroidota bacterium]